MYAYLLSTNRNYDKLRTLPLMTINCNYNTLRTRTLMLNINFVKIQLFRSVRIFRVKINVSVRI